MINDSKYVFKFIKILYNKYLKLFSLIFTLSLHSAYAQEISEERKGIAEPLMFDLVRGLGDAKGESEANTLAEFPIISESDIEWAPEYEYVLFKNFAIEFEFPFSN